MTPAVSSARTAAVVVRLVVTPSRMSYAPSVNGSPIWRRARIA